MVCTITSKKGGTVSETPNITLIPDNTREPIGVPTPASTAIVRRVLRDHGANVPVAAFQSSI
jgi:FXSXX-COOH protein